MRNARVAGQALSLATESAHRPYVCRACLAQANRQLSTSSRSAAAAEPFYQRIQKSLFGRSEESKEEEEKREEARKERLIDAVEADSVRVRQVTLRNGLVYDVAAVVDPTTHSDYIVSRDWTGLQKVGGEKWVKQRADQGEVYTGFLPPKQIKLENQEWVNLLHTIVVEVLTLQKAGRDVLQVCNPRSIDANTQNLTSDARVTYSDAIMKLSAQEKPILDSISETAQLERAPGSLELELQQASAPGFEGLPSTMKFKLDDPSIKFAVLKRTMQLTGKRIPDVKLSNVVTVENLAAVFATKEPPKRLHDTVQLQALGDTPNVQVHEKRRTHIHRDKEIGRWKLIKEELSMRGMPTGGRQPRLRSV